jgi:proliferating cell nuclear antigen
MKFKAAIIQKSLKDILEVMSGTMSEANIAVSPEGLRISDVDAASVLLTKIIIPADAFDLYEAEAGNLGVDIEKLKDMISSGDSGDMVVIEMSDKLDIKVGNLDWSMALIDPSSMRKPPRIPDLDLPAMVSMSGEEFRKMIVAADKVSDHIRIVMEDEIFSMKADGDVEKVSMSLGPDELIDIKYGCANSLFMLSYMKEISKGCKKATAVRLEFGQDYPLRVSTILKHRTSSETHISYLLAPRIETD